MTAESPQMQALHGVQIVFQLPYHADESIDYETLDREIDHIFVAGAEWGRVRALINDRGENIKEVGPSVPVEVLGLQGAPNAGDDFAVVVHHRETRARAVAVGLFPAKECVIAAPHGG